jgi:hypothetical protein
MRDSRIWRFLVVSEKLIRDEGALQDVTLRRQIRLVRIRVGKRMSVQLGKDDAAKIRTEADD